jgi:hypothetical protein
MSSASGSLTSRSHVCSNYDIMELNMRNTLIIGASIVMAGLLAGLLREDYAVAQSGSAGGYRYQFINAEKREGAEVKFDRVVFDAQTGTVYEVKFQDQKGQWFRRGSPAEAK